MQWWKQNTRKYSNSKSNNNNTVEKIRKGLRTLETKQLLGGRFKPALKMLVIELDINDLKFQ